MASLLSEFRSIAPDYCKHVAFLERYAKVSDVVMNDFLLRARAAKIIKSVPKMTEAFARLIKAQLLCANITMVIENVPDYGVRKSDNLPDRITARSIHDTMGEFGWFEDTKDALRAHSLINQMRMGNRIITTSVICV